MNRIIEFARMIRCVNCSMAGLAVIFTIFVAENYTVSNYTNIVIGFITGFLASSAAMLINDVVDLEVDKINKPWKPLPRGVFKPESIRNVSLILLTLGVLVNVFISFIALIIALIYSIIAYIYSFLRRNLYSQFLVSLAVTGPFIYGLTLAKTEKTVFIVLFSIVVFLINTSREFIKSIADVNGDLKYNYKTVATVYGIKNSAKTAFLLSLVGVIIAIVIGLTKIAGLIYTLTLGVCGVLYTLLTLKVVLNPAKAQNVKNMMIYLMLIALIGFLLSNIS
ncbi:MAG: geranylgeranylglycerol-phosphate geranylgeranyltransferase [Candidatus Methanomethylicia archaeon]